MNSINGQPDSYRAERSPSRSAALPFSAKGKEGEMMADDLRALSARQAAQLPTLKTREAKRRQVSMLLSTLLKLLKSGGGA